MLNKITNILECSRIFSLPMTILSWLVVFVYGVISSGNILYGILALIGISFVHMGTNVLDDYVDYKLLIKRVDFDKKEYIQNTQKTKCRYLITGRMSEPEVLGIAATYMFLAGIIGIFFLINCGVGILYFAFAGGIIALLYPFLSRIKLSELAVALAYGPILFGGVYFVMTKTFSWDLIILALPTMFMTVILLYIHTIMDYDYDLKEGHQTVANSYDSQLDSLILLKVFMVLSYATPILLCVFDIADWQIFLCYLTIPLAIDLYKSMYDYSTDSEIIPEKKWFHFPMENMNIIKKFGAESFMIRMYQSRNLMIYFATFLSIGIILSNL